MKRAAILITLLLLPVSALAQGKLFVYNAGDAVFLRYVEDQGDLPDGYNVYRRPAGGTTWQNLTEGNPIRPILSAENIRQIAGLRGEVLISMLGGDGSTRDFRKEDFDRVLTEPESRNFFIGMTLAIEGLGTAMGQEYVDSDIQPGSSFEYRITVLRGSSESDLVTSDPITHGERTILPIPTGLRGFSENENLFIDWDRDKGQEMSFGIIGYNIYRAEGDVSQPFMRVNSTPVLDIALGGSDSPRAFRDPLAVTGARYWYRITAVNTFGFESEPTGAVLVVAEDETAPPPVENLGARVTPDAVLLSWSAVEAPDLRGYEVHRSAGAEDAFVRIAPSRGKGISATTYVDSDVTPGEVYWYQVRAVDEAGNTGPFSLAVQVYQRDLIPPPKVLNLEADAEQAGRVILGWDAVDDPTLDGYTVERSLTPERTDEFWFRLANRIEAAAFTDTLWEMQQGEVSYRVRADDLSGNEGDWSDIVTVRPPDTVPPPPPFLKSIVVEGDSILLGWDPSRAEDVAGYHVSRSTDKGYGFSRLTRGLLPSGRSGTSGAAGAPGVVTYADRPQNTGIVYWYRVEAVDSDGNVSEPSNPMGITFSDEVPPPAPLNLEATSVQQGVHLRWGEQVVGDLKGYNIYRRGEKEREMVLLDQMPTRGAAFLDYTAEIGKTYSYQVSAFDTSYNISSPAGPVTIVFEPEEPEEPESEEKR